MACQCIFQPRLLINLTAAVFREIIADVGALVPSEPIPRQTMVTKTFVVTATGNATATP